MNKMIIGLCGPAGSGKDTIADYLVSKRGFVKMANADLLKRVVQSVFNFTDAQLWGPSELRNAPDKRYPRSHTWVSGGCACCGYVPHMPADSFEASGADDPPCFLTPRYVLQIFGTEAGRGCYPTIWVERLLGAAQELQAGGCYYDPKSGLRRVGTWMNGPEVAAKTSVVIPDVRFANEIEAIKSAGGKMVRVIRENTSLSTAAAQHQSETELLTMPSDRFDYVFQNRGDLNFLRLQADRMMDVLEERLTAFDPVLQDAPPFLREKCKELARSMLGAWHLNGTPQPGDPPPETWVVGTEVGLWSDLQDLLTDTKAQGRGPTNSYEEALLKLKELSDAVNGWFSWQNKSYDAPYFVRRGAWIIEYEGRKSKS